MTETAPMEPLEPAAPAATATAAEPTLVQKLSAEAIGTCILVLIGCGSVVLPQASGGGLGGMEGGAEALTFFNLTSIALAFGLAIVLAAYAFGRVSGGHFNPAVSVGAAISGRIAWREAGLYAAAQVGGAIVGALLLFVIALGAGYNSFEDGGVGANGFDGDAGFGWWGAGLFELLFTMLFVFVILALTDKRNDFAALAPLAIGLALAGIHFVGIMVSGTSVNPARSIGPALFSGTDALADVWLFILAPVLGAALAGLAYPAIFGRTDEPVAGSGLRFGGAKQAGVVPPGMPGHEFQQQWNQDPAQGAPAGAWNQPPAQAAPSQGGWGAPGQEVAPAPTQQPAPVTPADDGLNEQTQVKQSWQQPQQPAAEGELPVYEQDGWRWDYAKQEWVRIEDQP